MTEDQIPNLIADYNGGEGLNNMQLAEKYQMTSAAIRLILIRAKVYKPQRLARLSNLTGPKLPTDNTARKLMDANKLLLKVLQYHESGLLPDRNIYLEISNFLFDNKAKNERSL